MTVDVDEIRKQLAQDHNWQQQEKHWEYMQAFLKTSHEATEGNRREQEKHWLAQQKYYRLVVWAASLAVIINGLASFFGK